MAVIPHDCHITNIEIQIAHSHNQEFLECEVVVVVLVVLSPSCMQRFGKLEPHLLE